METSIPAWEVRRSGINHDRLKNIYYRGINAFILRLESSDADEAPVRRFLESDFHTWTDYNPLITELLMDYGREMSPRTLFDIPPLNRCDEDTKDWLGNLVHKLWMSRYDVENTIEKADSVLKAADRCYEGLCKKLAAMDSRDISLLKGLLEDFRDFRRACDDLIKVLSAFQRRVMVV